MQKTIDTLKNTNMAAIKEATSLADIEELRVATLGKKGNVSDLMKKLGGMTPEERKVFGPLLNTLKNDITDAIAERKTTLESEALKSKLESEYLDVTLPASDRPQGCIHPISQVMDEINEIFANLGFNVAEGPDLEDDFHNFTALNIPAEHPARQMHDTFYLRPDEKGERKILRTHTSPVQIRTMCSEDPPY